MKMKHIHLLILVSLLAVILSACTSQAGASNSWSGVLLTEKVVYYAGGNQVTALNSENGNVFWRYPEKTAATRLFYPEPVLVGDQLIAVDYDKKIASINAQTGAQTWMFEGAKGRYIDSPVVVDNLIIAPNTDHKLYAVDLSGNLVWSFESDHALWARPATDGTTVFFPSMDRNLYALDVATGTLKWKTDLRTSSVARALLADGVLYLGNLDGTFFAVSAEDGKIIWEQKVGGGVWVQPILHDGKLYFGDQTGRINILNSVDGEIVQYVETGSTIVGAGALLDDGLVFGNEKGELVFIGFDGERKWTRSFDGMIYANLQRLGNRLMVSLNKADKPLIALDTNGNEIWYFDGKK